MLLGLMPGPPIRHSPPWPCIAPCSIAPGLSEPCRKHADITPKGAFCPGVTDVPPRLPTARDKARPAAQAVNVLSHRRNDAVLAKSQRGVVSGELPMKLAPAAVKQPLLIKDSDTTIAIAIWTDPTVIEAFFMSGRGY
jgi:hypothetical protein